MHGEFEFNLKKNVKETVLEYPFLFYLVATTQPQEPADFAEGLIEIDEAYRGGFDHIKFKAFQEMVLEIICLEKDEKDVSKIVDKLYQNISSCKELQSDPLKLLVEHIIARKLTSDQIGTLVADQKSTGKISHKAFRDKVIAIRKSLRNSYNTIDKTKNDQEQKNQKAQFKTKIMSDLKISDTLFELVKEDFELILNNKELDQIAQQLEEGLSQAEVIQLIKRQQNLTVTGAVAVKQINLIRSKVEQAIDFIGADREARGKRISLDTDSEPMSGIPFGNLKDLVVSIRSTQVPPYCELSVSPASTDSRVSISPPSTAYVPHIMMKRPPVLKSRFEQLIREDDKKAHAHEEAMRSLSTPLTIVSQTITKVTGGAIKLPASLPSAQMEGVYAGTIPGADAERLYNFFKPLFNNDPIYKVERDNLLGVYKGHPKDHKQIIDTLFFSNRRFPGHALALRALTEYSSENFFFEFIQKKLNTCTPRQTQEVAVCILQNVSLFLEYSSTMTLTKGGLFELMGIFDSLYDLSIKDDALLKFVMRIEGAKTEQLEHRAQVQLIRTLLAQETVILVNIFDQSITETMIKQKEVDNIFIVLMSSIKRQEARLNLLLSLCDPSHTGSEFLQISAHIQLSKLLLDFPEGQIFNSDHQFYKLMRKMHTIFRFGNPDTHQSLQAEIIKAVISKCSDAYSKPSNRPTEFDYQKTNITIKDYDRISQQKLRREYASSSSSSTMSSSSSGSSSSTYSSSGSSGSSSSSSSSSPTICFPSSESKSQEIAIPPLMTHIATLLLLHTEQFYNQQDDLLKPYFEQIIRWDQHQCFLFVLAIAQAQIDTPVSIQIKNQLLDWFAASLMQSKDLTLLALAEQEFNMPEFATEANQMFLLDALSPQFVEHKYRTEVKQRLSRVVYIKEQLQKFDQKEQHNLINDLLAQAQNNDLPYLWLQRSALKPLTVLKLAFALLPGSLLGKSGLKSEYKAVSSIIESVRKRLDATDSSLTEIRVAFYETVVKTDFFEKEARNEFHEFLSTGFQEIWAEMEGLPSLQTDSLLNLFNSLTIDFEFKPVNLFNKELIELCNKEARGVSSLSLEQIKSIFIKIVLHFNNSQKISVQHKQNFFDQISGKKENISIIENASYFLSIYNLLTVNSTNNLLLDMPPLFHQLVKKCLAECKTKDKDDDIKQNFVENVLKYDEKQISRETKIAFVETLRRLNPKLLSNIVRKSLKRITQLEDTSPEDQAILNVVNNYESFTEQQCLKNLFLCDLFAEAKEEQDRLLLDDFGSFDIKSTKSELKFQDRPVEPIFGTTLHHSIRLLKKVWRSLSESSKQNLGGYICKELLQVGAAAMPIQCFLHIMMITDLWNQFSEQKSLEEIAVSLINRYNKFKVHYQNQHVNFRIALDLLLDSKDFTKELPALKQFIKEIWGKNKKALISLLAQEFSGIDLFDEKSQVHMLLQSSIRMVEENPEDHYNLQIMDSLNKAILLNTDEEHYATFSLISTQRAGYSPLKNIYDSLQKTNKRPIDFLHQLARHYVSHQMLLQECKYHEETFIIERLKLLQIQTIEFFMDFAKKAEFASDIARIILDFSGMNPQNDYFNNSFALYLVKSIDLAQSYQFDENVILLTNENTVYFIVLKDGMIMKGEQPRTVKNIDRQTIALVDSDIPQKYQGDKKLEKRVIRESLWKIDRSSLGSHFKKCSFAVDFVQNVALQIDEEGHTVIPEPITTACRQILLYHGLHFKHYAELPTGYLKSFIKFIQNYYLQNSKQQTLLMTFDDKPMTYVKFLYLFSNFPFTAYNKYFNETEYFAEEEKQLIPYNTQQYFRFTLMMQYFCSGIVATSLVELKTIAPKLQHAVLKSAELCLRSLEIKQIFNTFIPRMLALGELVLPELTKDKDNFICLRILKILIMPKQEPKLSNLTQLLQKIAGVDELKTESSLVSVCKQLLKKIFSDETPNFISSLLVYLQESFSSEPSIEHKKQSSKVEFIDDLHVSVAYSHFGYPLSLINERQFDDNLFKCLSDGITSEVSQRQEIVSKNGGVKNIYCTALLSRLWVTIEQAVAWFEKKIQNSDIQFNQPFRVEDEESSATEIIQRLLSRINLNSEVKEEAKLQPIDLYHHQLIVASLAYSYDVNSVWENIVAAILKQLARECKVLNEKPSSETQNLAWGEQFCKIIHFLRAIYPGQIVAAGKEAITVSNELKFAVSIIGSLDAEFDEIEHFFVRCYAQPCFEAFSRAETAETISPLLQAHFNYFLSDKVRKTQFTQAMQAFPTIEYKGADYAFAHFSTFLTICFKGAGLNQEIIHFVEELEKTCVLQKTITQLRAWCVTIIQAIPNSSSIDKKLLLQQTKLRFLNHLEYDSKQGFKQTRIPTVMQCLNILNQAADVDTTLSTIDSFESLINDEKNHSNLAIAYRQIKENSDRQRAVSLFAFFELFSVKGINYDFIIFDDSVPKSKASGSEDGFPIDECFFKLLKLNKYKLLDEDVEELKNLLADNRKTLPIQIKMAQFMLQFYADDLVKDQRELLYSFVQHAQSNQLSFLQQMRDYVYASNTGYLYLACKQIQSPQSNVFLAKFTRNISGILKTAELFTEIKDFAALRLNHSAVIGKMLSAVSREIKKRVLKDKNTANLIENSQYLFKRLDTFVNSLGLAEEKDKLSFEKELVRVWFERLRPQGALVRILWSSYLLNNDEKPNLAKYFTYEYIEELISFERLLSSMQKTQTDFLILLNLITYLKAHKSNSTEEAQQQVGYMRLQYVSAAFHWNDFERQTGLIVNCLKYLVDHASASESKKNEELSRFVICELASRIKYVLKSNTELLAIKQSNFRNLAVDAIVSLLGTKDALNKWTEQELTFATQVLQEIDLFKTVTLYGQAVNLLEHPQCWAAWLILLRRIIPVKDDKPNLDPFNAFLQLLNQVIETEKYSELGKHITYLCLLFVQKELCDNRQKRSNQLRHKQLRVQTLIDKICSREVSSIQIHLNRLVAELEQEDGLRISSQSLGLVKQILSEIKEGRTLDSLNTSVFDDLPAAINRAALRATKQMVQNAQNLLDAVSSLQSDSHESADEKIWKDVFGEEIAKELAPLRNYFMRGRDLSLALAIESKEIDEKKFDIVTKNYRELLSEDQFKLTSILGVTESISQDFFQYCLTYGNILGSSKQIQDCLNWIASGFNFNSDFKDHSLVAQERLSMVINFVWGILIQKDQVFESQSSAERAAKLVQYAGIFLHKLLLEWNEIARQKILADPPDSKTLSPFIEDLCMRLNIVFEGYPRDVSQIKFNMTVNGKLVQDVMPIAKMTAMKVLDGSLSVLQHILSEAKDFLPSAGLVEYINIHYWRRGDLELAYPLPKESKPIVGKLKLRTNLLSLPDKLIRPFEKKDIAEIKLDHSSLSFPDWINKMISSTCDIEPSQITLWDNLCKTIVNYSTAYAAQEFLRNIVLAFAGSDLKKRLVSVRDIILSLPSLTVSATPSPSELAWYKQCLWLIRLGFNNFKLSPTEIDKLSQTKIDWLELGIDSTLSPYSCFAQYQQAWENIRSEKLQAFAEAIKSAEDLESKFDPALGLIHLLIREKRALNVCVSKENPCQFYLHYDVEKIADVLENYFQAMGVSGYQLFGIDGVLGQVFLESDSYEQNVQRWLAQPSLTEEILRLLAIKAVKIWQPKLKKFLGESEVKNQKKPLSPLENLEQAITVLSECTVLKGIFNSHFKQIKQKINQWNLTEFEPDPSEITAQMQCFFSIFNVKDPASREIHLLFLKRCLAWAIAFWRDDSENISLVVAVLDSVKSATDMFESEQLILDKLLGGGEEISKLAVDLKEHSITEWTLVEQVAAIKYHSRHGLHHFQGRGLCNLVPFIEYKIHRDKIMSKDFFISPKEFDNAYDSVSVISLILRKLGFSKNVILIACRNITAKTGSIQSHLIGYLRTIKKTMYSKVEKKPVKWSDWVTLDKLIKLLQQEPAIDSDLAFAYDYIPLDQKPVMEWYLNRNTVKPSSELDRWKKKWHEKLYEKYLSKCLSANFRGYLIKQTDNKFKNKLKDIVAPESKWEIYVRFFVILFVYADFMKSVSKKFEETPVSDSNWSAPVIQFLDQMSEIIQYPIFPTEVKDNEEEKRKYISNTLDVLELKDIDPLLYSPITDLFVLVFKGMKDRLDAMLERMAFPEDELTEENAKLIRSIFVGEITFLDEDKPTTSDYPPDLRTLPYSDFILSGNKAQNKRLSMSRCRRLTENACGIYETGSRRYGELIPRSRIKTTLGMQLKTIGVCYFRLIESEPSGTIPAEVLGCTQVLVIRKPGKYELNFVKSVLILKLDQSTKRGPYKRAVENCELIIVKKNNKGLYELSFCSKESRKYEIRPLIQSDEKNNYNDQDSFLISLLDAAPTGYIDIRQGEIRQKLLFACANFDGCVIYKKPASLLEPIRETIEDKAVISSLNAISRPGIITDTRLQEALVRLCTPSVDLSSLSSRSKGISFWRSHHSSKIKESVSLDLSDKINGNY